MRRPLVAMAMVILTGCGQSLPEGTVKALLLPYQQQHCVERVVFRSPVTWVGNATSTQFTKPLQQWIYFEVDNPELFERGRETKRAGTTHMEITQPYKATDGGEIVAVSHDVHSIGEAPNLTLHEVRGCFARAAEIIPLDITIDKDTGKQATVIFRQRDEPNSAGQTLQKSGVSESIARGLPPATVEYQATLERLDKSGWRVVETHPREPSQ